MAEEQKPAKPVGEAKPVVKKAATPAYQEFKDSALLESIKQHLPEAVASAHSFLGLNYLVTTPSQLIPLAELLKTDSHLDYSLLEDVTAVDYRDREKRFELVYIFFSISRNDRLIVKTAVADGESAPSLAGHWSSANWAEREVFDMFGVRFDGHPDLKRILMPDGWNGFPLRKEYNIEKQDEEWIAKNMKLRAPQSLFGIPSNKEIEHVRKAQDS